MKKSWNQLGVFTAVCCCVLMAASANAQWATNGSNIYNTNGGNVGIKTSTPTYPFEVEGTASTADATAGFIRNLLTSSGSLFFAYGAHFEADLTYNGTSVADASGAEVAMRWRGSGSTGSMGNKSVGALGIYAFNYNTGTTDWLSGGRFDIRNIGNGSSFGNVTNMAGFRVSAPIISGGTVTNWYGLYFDDPGAPATHTYSIYIAGGNVHLGSSMDVSGDVTVGGNIAAKYQDVAEWVPASEPLAAGTVVVLDKERTNNVIASSSAYDTGVAGVISATPGLLLGQADTSKVKVATTGRVKVKVDASKEPIRVGDLLVTADTSGMAMRSDPIDIGGVKIHRPGTIVGKALEPLASGQGEILVLLSLQ